MQNSSEGQALVQNSLERAAALCDSLGEGAQEPEELSTVVVIPFWTGFGKDRTPKFNSDVGLEGRIQQVSVTRVAGGLGGSASDGCKCGWATGACLSRRGACGIKGDSRVPIQQRSVLT